MRQKIGHYRFDALLVLTNSLLRLPGHAFRLWVLRRLALWRIDEPCAIERGMRIRTRGGVRIGRGTNVNRDALFDAGGGLEVGTGVNFSPEVMVLTTEHDPQSPSFAGRSRPVHIGDRAWIATRATILPGSTIGEGALVAAGAVVHGQVEPWTIVAGNPAVVIGRRSTEAQSDLPLYRRFLH